MRFMKFQKNDELRKALHRRVGKLARCDVLLSSCLKKVELNGHVVVRTASRVINLMTSPRESERF
jgi:hypothetical protein